MNSTEQLCWWKKQRKDAAEPVEAAACTDCNLQSDASTEVMSDSNESCDIYTQVLQSTVGMTCDDATNIETPESHRRSDAAVQTQVCANMLDEQAKALASLEEENSELCRLVNIYEAKIETLNKSHSFALKNLRNECEAEKSRLRNKMQQMHHEMMLQHEQIEKLKYGRKRPGKRMRESAGSEDFQPKKKRSHDEQPAKHPSKRPRVHSVIVKTSKTRYETDIRTRGGFRR